MASPVKGRFKISLGNLNCKSATRFGVLQEEGNESSRALGEDETDEPLQQLPISGWDIAEGGALAGDSMKQEEGFRIIYAQSNLDRGAEARRKNLHQAPQHQVHRLKMIMESEDKEEINLQSGRTIIKREKHHVKEDVQAPGPIKVLNDPLTEDQKLEKNALDALLTGKSIEEGLVIPIQPEEKDFFNRVQDAPEPPTLESYEAQPIKGFGAALLRGMGWKDGEAFGKNIEKDKAKEFKRRPALLGIGAKAEAAVGVELGAWGPKSGIGKRMDQGYIPVALRNKRTGEIIPEEKLKAKLETQDGVSEGKSRKNSRKYSIRNENDEEKWTHRGAWKSDKQLGSDIEREGIMTTDTRRGREEKGDGNRRRDKRREGHCQGDGEHWRGKKRNYSRSRSPSEPKKRRSYGNSSWSQDMTEKHNGRDGYHRFG